MIFFLARAINHYDTKLLLTFNMQSTIPSNFCDCSIESIRGFE
jgi:hypothetical protein